MTITNGYATLAEFKAYAIPNSSPDTVDNGVIEAIVEAASRWLDLQTGEKYYTSAADETRYFTATDPLFLNTGNLVSVTTLAIDDGSRAWGTTLAATDYDLYPYNAAAEGKPYTGIEITSLGTYALPLIRKGIKIVGKFGYATAPDYINQACLELTKNIYQRRHGENNTGQVTITASGVVITPQDVSDFVRSVITAKRSRV